MQKKMSQVNIPVHIFEWKVIFSKIIRYKIQWLSKFFLIIVLTSGISIGQISI